MDDDEYRLTAQSQGQRVSVCQVLSTSKQKDILPWKSWIVDFGVQMFSKHLLSTYCVPGSVLAVDLAHDLLPLYVVFWLVSSSSGG